MFRFVRDKAKYKQIELNWTPLEISEAAARGEVRLRNLIVGPLLENEPPRRFVRHVLSPTAILYSGAPGDHGLLAIFTGKGGYPMVPISVILQIVDERRFDVLLLSDPARFHFAYGAEPFGSDLASLAEGLRRFADERGYGRRVTYGESMGGLPALAVGGMMRADRAISVGGRFAWHIGRLLKGRSVPAFEALCPCTQADTEMLLIYSEAVDEDRIHADLVRSRVKRARLIGIDHWRHNPIRHLYDRGELKAFWADLFSGEDRLAPQAGAA